MWLSQRDIFKDLAKLESSYKGSKEDGEEFAIDDLEIFENVAHIMAYHTDHTIPGNVDDWPDQFEMFSIYEVLPKILALWSTNLVTDIESKKLKKSSREMTTLLFLLRCLEIGLRTECRTRERICGYQSRKNQNRKYSFCRHP